MTGVEPWNVPRSGSVQGGPKRVSYEGFTYIQDVFRAGADDLGVEVPRFHPPRPSRHFTASTCPKCSAIILSGTTYGLRLDLEPRLLNDETEYLALRDGVRTYNLLPDRTAQRRHYEEIKNPERHPRHAEHICGTTYGTDAPARSPEPARRPNIDDDPGF